MDKVFMPSSKQSTSLWFRLLKRQRDDGQTGYTPSFLIGASLPPGSKLDEQAAYIQFVSLLAAFMKDSPPGYDVLIGKCTGHHQPIASLYRSEDPKPPCDAVLDHRSTRTALYAESRYFETKARDLDSLIAGLWRTFKSPLLNGEYSYRGTSYCTFNSEELKLIEALRT